MHGRAGSAPDVQAIERHGVAKLVRQRNVLQRQALRQRLRGQRPPMCMASVHARCAQCRGIGLGRGASVARLGDVRPRASKVLHSHGELGIGLVLVRHRLARRPAASAASPRAFSASGTYRTKHYFFPQLACAWGETLCTVQGSRGLRFEYKSELLCSRRKSIQVT